MSTLPAKTQSDHETVNSIIVDPASAPTPTLKLSCALSISPNPENNMMAPSGTAPRIGKTTPPTRPLKEGTSKSKSDPSDIRFDATKSAYPYESSNHIKPVKPTLLGS